MQPVDPPMRMVKALLAVALATLACSNSTSSDGGVDAATDVKPDGYVPGCEMTVCGQTTYVLKNQTTTVDSCGDQCTCTVLGEDDAGQFVELSCDIPADCPCDAGTD